MISLAPARGTQTLIRFVRGGLVGTFAPGQPQRRRRAGTASSQRDKFLGLNAELNKRARQVKVRMISIIAGVGEAVDARY
jgi:hypothetical protein